MGTREQAVLDFLGDEQATAFVTRHVNTPLNQSRFSELAMPEGISHSEMWNILMGFRRLQGVLLINPLAAGAAGISWFNETPSIAENLARLIELGADDGLMATTLASPALNGIRLSPFANELRAALSRDGVAVSFDALSALLQEHRAPYSDADRAILNLVAFLRELPDYADRELNGALIVAINDRVTQGVDLGAPPQDRPPMPNYRHDVDEATIVEALANTWSRGERGEMHPLVAAISGSDALWQYRPFASGNALTELALRCLYLHRAHLSGLLFCPLCDPCLRWERGELSESEAPYQINDQGFSSDFGIDATFFYDQKISLYRQEAEKLAALASDVAAETSLLCGLIRNDYRLNHRQTALLEEAINDPRISHDVRSFSEEHRVSLVTARTDLQKLEEFGYLFSSGKLTYVRYYPHADLAARIMRFSGEGQ